MQKFTLIFLLLRLLVRLFLLLQLVFVLLRLPVFLALFPPLLRLPPSSASSSASASSPASLRLCILLDVCECPQAPKAICAERIDSIAEGQRLIRRVQDLVIDFWWLGVQNALDAPIV